MPEQNPIEQGSEIEVNDEMRYTIASQGFSLSPHFENPFTIGNTTGNDTCRICGRHCNETDTDFYWEENVLWCSNCYTDRFYTCESCEEIRIRRGDPSWGGQRDRRFCHECTDDIEHVSCERCGNYFLENDPEWEAGDGTYCFECVAERQNEGEASNNSFRYHDPRMDESYITGAIAGKILTSLRPVGIELEAEFKDKKKALKGVGELSRAIGLGTDASITGMGLEFRFPPASGNLAEELTTTTCAILKKSSFDVNPSCGYHIHIDMADFGEMPADKQLMALKLLWIMYIAFEEVIVSFLPVSRHANRYCKTIRSEYSIGEVLSARNRDDLERMWYRVRTAADLHRCKSDTRHSYSDDQTRYRGINFHPFWKEGHMEVRYHTGTLRPEKILEWANLHARIVDVSANMKVNKETIEYLKDACNSNSLTLKTDRFFSLLSLPSKSKGYFLARQMEFRIKEQERKEDATIKSGLELINSEKEI